MRYRPRRLIALDTDEDGLVMLASELDMFRTDETEFRPVIASIRDQTMMRRAFSAFEPKEKNSIIDILSDLWDIDAGGIAEFLQEELSEEEQGKLDELNDFDFDF